MVRNKKAFTLVETIISMMVIMIVMVGSLSSLTKMKPRIEAVTLRGQYGCWAWDSAAASALGISAPSGVADGDMVEWYFDERTERTNEPILVSAGETCKLKLDQRPAHFYILATGAGDGINPAQVTSVYTPAISNELSVQLGKRTPMINESRTTSVLNGDQAINASGAFSASSYGNFFPSNIKSCKVVKDMNDKAISCDVVLVTNHNQATDTYENYYRIRLNELEESLDVNGNPNPIFVEFSDIQLLGGISSMYNVNFESIAPRASAIKEMSTNHADMYKGTYNGRNVFLNFENYNSSNVPANQLLSYVNNLNNNYSTDTRSKMTKIIENISVRRQSKLTELFKSLNAGGPNKNGAVLILW